MKLSRLKDPFFQASMRKLMMEQLPLKAAFKIKGISQSVDNELRKYEEVRLEALKRFGDKKEDGSLDLTEDGNVKFQPDKLKQFTVDLQELLDANVEVGSIKADELGEHVKLSADELMALDGVIV